ncbi:NAD-dependent epimerase/dehydratase family protein [Oerskovia paurometabola]|uniref:NAD-dependent epimerase/dehydratase family protein n=1 Tax=Oerskovia paurometabola TaxID=162170 RepID=A0ABW1XI05_9CELL|nr:NAD-dependent epimerase/dehydratase family protein [Oerskovia paurometabola]MBM7495363.1 nucleoside-diphosphate-sugar epimerase [Oerskovia paurometabola]
MTDGTRLLVLGGTEFVGRAVVDDALARGWDVTTFHRGTREAPHGVRVRHGDRTVVGGLDALAEGEWDVAVDTWSGAPSAVRDVTRLLDDRVGRYVYVSSRSVYTYPTEAGAGEDAPLVEASPDDGADVDYARAKRGGELAVEESFGHRAILARAGLILGPRENVGRLPWWLQRIARGGPVLAPGPSALPLQYVDARDLAAFVLDATEQGLSGPFNVVSPSGHATMGELLDACVTATGSDAELRWTAPDVIAAAGIEPWTELPVWLPPGDLHDTLHRGDVSRAIEAGLRNRPVEETVADTWAWLGTLPDGAAPQRADRPRVGLDPDKEARALAG